MKTCETCLHCQDHSGWFDGEYFDIFICMKDNCSVRYCETACENYEKYEEE